nr:hypothetical protein Iba_chr12cCG9370 [Ipomoea batatas]
MAPSSCLNATRDCAPTIPVPFGLIAHETHPSGVPGGADKREAQQRFLRIVGPMIKERRKRNSKRDIRSVVVEVGGYDGEGEENGGIDKLVTENAPFMKRASILQRSCFLVEVDFYYGGVTFWTSVSSGGNPMGTFGKKHEAIACTDPLRYHGMLTRWVRTQKARHSNSLPQLGSTSGTT